MNLHAKSVEKRALFFPAKRPPVLFSLREYFFPSGCGGCGGALLDAWDAYFGLCDKCRNIFAGSIEGEKHCRLCGKFLVSEKDTCLSCRERIPAGRYSNWLERVYTFFPYTGLFRNVLVSFKFGGALGIGNFFAAYLKQAFYNPEILTTEDAALVPVPPRPGKIKSQGWDQIEVLAGLLEKEHWCSLDKNSPPVTRCLKRLSSRTQKELNREQRATNLKGRILCIKKPPRTAILFDDVITTGATLNACAAALLEGGAKKVYSVCLFYD